MIRSLPLVLCLLLLSTPAMAHKVIASVFPSGSDIEGEIGFSNGDMAIGQLVEVFDAEGNKLGETATDQDGFFLYTPKDPVTHVFKADLGAGHVAEIVMPAGEVAALLGVEVPPEAAGGPGSEPGGTTVGSLSDEERAAIAQIVRQEMRPLRREIASYREQNDLQSILGGIGYICGLFGLGFYIAARRRMAG